MIVGCSRVRGGQSGHTGHQRELLPLLSGDPPVHLQPERCEHCSKDLCDKAARFEVPYVPTVTRQSLFAGPRGMRDRFVSNISYLRRSG